MARGVTRADAYVRTQNNKEKRASSISAKIKEYKDGSLAEFSVPRVLSCNLPHTAHAPTSGKCTSKFLY